MFYMKIGLDAGHCRWGADLGARGCGMKEEEMTRTIVNQVSKKLQALGHRIIICNIDKASTVRESLNARSNKANSNNVDLYVSVHINAGGGIGSEVFTMNGRHFPQADRVLTNLVSLGFRNRGIKDGSHLSVIRRTNGRFYCYICYLPSVFRCKRFLYNYRQLST